MTLRDLSNKLNIDSSLIAKIERNERSPSKDFIRQAALFFNIDEKILRNEIISDSIAYRIIDENADLSILKVAEKKVKYLKNINNGRSTNPKGSKRMG